MKFRNILIILAMLIFASAGRTFAQNDRSTSRDTPTPIQNNKVEDDLDGSDDSYFYKFTASPGKVTITFEVEAAETNAGANFDLYDSNSRPLLSSVLVQGVDKGSERTVKSIKVTKKQDVIIRVKGIKYGESGGRGTYTISLDGSVEKAIQQAPPENQKPPE